MREEEKFRELTTDLAVRNMNYGNDGATRKGVQMTSCVAIIRKLSEQKIRYQTKEKKTLRAAIKGVMVKTIPAEELKKARITRTGLRLLKITY